MENRKVNESKISELNSAGEKKECLKPEKNKHSVIIIGASSGIGYESALKLIGRNYEVFNVSRTPCPLERVKNYAADITVGSTLEKALRIIAEKTPNINAMIYCAGVSMAAPIEYVDSKDYRYLFEVNYFGALRAIQAIVPYMKKRGGRIILISSMAGLFPVAFDSFYSSSKAALDMLAESAAIELEPYNIRLTSLQPGGTSTSFTFKRKVYNEEENGEYATRLHRATAALAEMEQEGMSAGEVAKTVIDVLEAKKPPTHVQCGKKNKIFAAAGRVFPQNFSLYLNKKKYGQ